MAGGCPYYGSGSTVANNNARRSVVSATQKPPIPKVRMDREEKAFRDVSLFFLTSTI